MATPNLKIVLIGNMGVGKTSMLITYSSGKFPSVYTPFTVEIADLDSMVDGQQMCVRLWDTAGGDDFVRLRPLCYPDTHVFCLCFDIGDRETLDCIPGKWIPEVRRFCPEVPIMLIGCKKDLRDSTPDTCVPMEEAERMAEDWKMVAYFETSALFNDGLVAVFKQCMRIGYHQFTIRQRNLRPLNRLRKRFKCHRRQSPVMPLEEPLPVIENDPSSFAEDWVAAFKAQERTDLIFVLGSGKQLGAHQIVLCAASPFFANIINSKHRFEALSNAQSVGISNIEEGPQHDGHATLTIALKADVEDHTLRQCLQFLYSGLPGIGLDEEPGSVKKLITLSQLWEIHLLETICNNIKNEDSHLNPSIAVSHNSEMGEKLKQHFLFANKWTDVTFDVEGHHISAHRLVLCTRCRVFATMLSDRFREGTVTDSSICIPNTTCDSFKALLEYLYSDHAPIEEGDPVGILVLANQFCQTRLVTLAEYYITKGIENSFETKGVAGADVDVFGILNNAKDHNAQQLPEWCLYFIARNYKKIKPRPEFKELTVEHRAFVEEHQWPPLSYIRELEQYRAAQRMCTVL